MSAAWLVATASAVELQMPVMAAAWLRSRSSSANTVRSACARGGGCDPADRLDGLAECQAMSESGDAGKTFGEQQGAIGRSVLPQSSRRHGICRRSAGSCG